MLTPLEVREAVHVTLLRRLVERLPNGLRLKGGVNLRLYHGSLRYSEDMDLDADPRHRFKVPELLVGILDDRGCKRELDDLGIEDIRANERQQGATDVGFRFKLQALVASVNYHTKVDVSFRASSPSDWAIPRPVPQRFIERHGEVHFSVQSYEHAAAVVQKMNALATRTDV